MFVNDIFEAKDRGTAVMTYGRINPPTIGHEALYQKMQEVASQHNATPMIFLSHTQDSKRNPLKFGSKAYYVQHLLNANIANKNKPAIRTPVDALNWLSSMNFNKVIFIVGQDRIESFKQVTAYNGKKTKEGIVPFHFKNGIDIVSSGARDPDGEGVEGMSASKVRELARTGNFNVFSSGIPGNDVQLKKKLFDELRKEMKVTEMMENDNRIIPDGGIGSWTYDALVKNLEKELTILTTQIPHDARNVYYHLTKGSIVKKLEALAKAQDQRSKKR